MPAIDDNTSLCFRPISQYTQAPNLNGQRFGKLFVIGILGKRKKRAWWLCRCDCGRLSTTMTTYLIKGDTIACGCMVGRTGTHGMNDTPVHHAWTGAKQRCYNANHKDYIDYKSRGMCEGWRASFERFFADMGQPPTPHHSIERIDNSLGYHCGSCGECQRQGWAKNCRWDTPTAQARNRRSTLFVRYRGDEKPLAEWAEILNIPYKNLWRRFRQGKFPL